MKISHKLVCGYFLLLLTACGGGDGSDGASNTPINSQSVDSNESAPPQNINLDNSQNTAGSISQLLQGEPTEAFPSHFTVSNLADGFALVTEATIEAGSATALLIAHPAGSLEQVTWQQTSGPSITSATMDQPMLAFDVQQPGEYQFTVEVITSNGTQVFPISIFAVDTPNEQIDVFARLSHVVSEQDDVSFHVSIGEGNGSANPDISTIEWTQVFGPKITSGQTNQAPFIFFEAPTVDSDSLIVMRADLTFDDDTSAREFVMLYVNDIAIDEDGYFASNGLIPFARMKAYRPDSPYADALASCVYNAQLSRSCSFRQLPLIGMADNGGINSSPSIDDVLDRVFVSHKWMGQRFEDYLRNSVTGPDMIRLLGATTAIVISYEVRPSFYWTATGAIYLDANNFWQTAEERDTLNDRPDFRADFGNDLQFVVPWRYVKNNQYYPARRYPKENRDSRSFAEVEADLAWLMYHELAHANDYFPATSWRQIALNSSPLQSAGTPPPLSDTLEQLFPLNSNIMKDLAQVRFQGENANSTQKSYRAEDLVSEFSQDAATTFYPYLNNREDFATLFEHYMMLTRLDASVDVALLNITNNPERLVAWGQRRRIQDVGVRERAVWVIEQIMPDQNPALDLTDHPGSVLMDPSLSWFSNINLDVKTGSNTTINGLSVRQPQRPPAAVPLLPQIHGKQLHFELSIGNP